MGGHAEHTDPDPALSAALVEEAMKKSAVCWLRLPGDDRDHGGWHLWHQGAAYVVSGGAEQHLPGIDAARSALVICRTKDSRQRLLAWRADVSTVTPQDDAWAAVTGALAASRLNLTDADGAAQRWARECTVSRLTPTGELDAELASTPDGDLAATPAPTPATTRRALPRVLHRRQTRRPDLR